MSEHGADTPEQVLKFVPKEWPNSYGAQVEEVGQAVVAKIQRAADLSDENCEPPWRWRTSFRCSSEPPKIE